MCGLAYDLSALAREEEPDFGPAPTPPRSSQFLLASGEPIDLAARLDWSLPHVGGWPTPAAEERPAPSFTVTPQVTELDPVTIDEAVSWVPEKQGPRSWRIVGLDLAAEERPYLPIHRAMARMLRADERYDNRVFLPGGQFVADEPREGHE